LSQGAARSRGLAPHPHRHDRGPSRGSARLLGEARAAVQGTLSSVARLPDILGSLSPEAQAVYDRITAKRGKIGGPYAPLMHPPAVAEHLGSVGEHLLWGSTPRGDLRERAILIAAREVSHPFEWVVHAGGPQGRPARGHHRAHPYARRSFEAARALRARR